MQINFCEFINKPENFRKVIQRLYEGNQSHKQFGNTLTFYPIFLTLFVTLYSRCRKPLKQIFEEKHRMKPKKFPLRQLRNFYAENL